MSEPNSFREFMETVEDPNLTFRAGSLVRVVGGYDFLGQVGVLLQIRTNPDVAARFSNFASYTDYKVLVGDEIWYFDACEIAPL